MPVRGYRNFTVKTEAADKLQEYASANGLKLVHLVSVIAEKIETDVPLMYLLKSIENSKLLILKETVKAEYLRDLLVRLYLHIRNVSIGLQTLLPSHVDLGSLSTIKSQIASMSDALDYQARRIEKVLDEAYPKGWMRPLPPPPPAYGFLQPHSGNRRMDRIIKEQLLSFLTTIQSQIADAMKILDKIKLHLPEIFESVGEALDHVNLKIGEICAKCC
jgi:hypothetical protein